MYCVVAKLVDKRIWFLLSVVRDENFKEKRQVTIFHTLAKHHANGDAVKSQETTRNKIQVKEAAKTHRHDKVSSLGMQRGSAAPRYLLLALQPVIQSNGLLAQG